MEEIVEKISRIIRNEFKASLCAGELDTEKIAKEIWKFLLNDDRIILKIPEGASGCCEVTE